MVTILEGDDRCNAKAGHKWNHDAMNYHPNKAIEFFMKKPWKGTNVMIFCCPVAWNVFAKAKSSSMVAFGHAYTVNHEHINIDLRGTRALNIVLC